MFMKLKDGKSKVLTLSYDDGVVQDIRLIGLMNKHGIKGTFNINTGCYFPEDKERMPSSHMRMRLSEAMDLYIGSGQEVAVHSLGHPYLEKMKPADVMREILEDRKNIEQQYGTLARGMAYPYGTYNDMVVEVLGLCGICYSRTVKSTRKFDFPENWLTLHPTCHHNDPKLMELAREFADGKPLNALVCQMFYLWGHSYEFDNNDNWKVIEEFVEYVAGREDIWYATNIEIYDYVKAYERLQVSVDHAIVHNPSDIDVWFFEKGETYCVKAGQTLRLGE
jgi:peptidoglycan/xylan/chitin deacetylase (PgdA/CDA1 family)